MSYNLYMHILAYKIFRYMAAEEYFYRQRKICICMCEEILNSWIWKEITIHHRVFSQFCHHYLWILFMHDACKCIDIKSYTNFQVFIYYQSLPTTFAATVKKVYWNQSNAIFLLIDLEINHYSTILWYSYFKLLIGIFRYLLLNLCIHECKI